MNKELTPLEAFYELGDNTPITDTWKIVENALKALEIIKEQLRYFIDYDENTKNIYIDGAIDCNNQEYELLKEVLL